MNLLLFLVLLNPLTKKENISQHIIHEIQGEGIRASIIQKYFKKDSSIIVPPIELMYRIYTDPDFSALSFDTLQIEKSNVEITGNILTRLSFEQLWIDYLLQNVKMIDTNSWMPIVENGKFSRYSYRRGHEAIDIFEDIGTPILSPINGLIVSAGDDWWGEWDTLENKLIYYSEGFSRKAGNAVLLFDPCTEGYLYFSHLQKGLEVEEGQIVRQGDTLGYIGLTGNSLKNKGRWPHVHFAFKLPEYNHETFPGILQAINPYNFLVKAEKNYSE